MAEIPENWERGNNREREKGGLMVGCASGTVAAVAVTQLASVGEGRGVSSAGEERGLRG